MVFCNIGLGGLFGEVLMLEIKVRAANEDEKLGIVDDENEGRPCLPKGVNGFDGTDWYAHFFLGLGYGDWVVEIIDPDNILKWTDHGTYIIQNEDDGGFVKKI